MTALLANTKRERLIEAAARLFHKHGVAATSLKDVAQASKVPLGSVYYYYPTKDDLTRAVIVRRQNHVAGLVARHAQCPDPVSRLHALIDVWVADRDIDARYGCPIGSLCFEVARARQLDAAGPFRVLLDWCAEQFRALGTGADAARHAVHLIAALQGISLTASVMADARLIAMEAKYLKHWVRGLDRGDTEPRGQATRRAAKRVARRKRRSSTR